MEDSPQATPCAFNWDEAAPKASRVVEDLVARLPPELQTRAAEVSWEVCGRSKEPDEQDVLGCYYRSGQVIRLYLEAIHDYCVQNSVDFERQVENTSIHELGHHIGLDEQSLEERGL